MPYPTQVRIPIQASTLDVLERAVKWAKAQGIEQVPVIYDDGSQGTIALPYLILELKIAQVNAEVETATSLRDRALGELQTLGERLDDLMMQRG